MSSFGYDLLGFGSSANTGGGGDPVDDEFNRVSFLSHFDGANNGVNNAFDDGSASNHTITANGDATQGSFGPFARPDGEWGVDFSGTAGDYINYASSADWSPATGDFTVEFWINPRAWDQAYMPVFVVDHSGGSGGGLFIGLGSNSGTKKFVVNGYADSDIIGYATLPALNTWTHILVSRSGTSLKLFYDGAAVATATSSYNFGQSDLTIGSYGNYSRYLNATISNLHYVKGTATQTSNFTPPTGPSTAVTNTKLLACQSNRFVDNSASPHASTVAGNVAVTAFGPFLTDEVYDPAVNGASGYFDGTGDYLTVPNSSDFDLGPTFTIDTWLYKNGAGDGTIAGRWYVNNNAHWIFHVFSSGKLAFGTGSGSFNNTSSVAIPENSWVHVAVSNDSSGKRLYINGVQYGSFSQDNPASGSSIGVGIAASSNGDSPINAYLYNFRIIKGTAVYTGSTYTVPTAPLTAVTNTKLLLNMADGQAIDSAAQTNLSLIGGAKISTAQSKFGDSSMVFDGTGDRADLIDNGLYDMSYGSGDFTLEGWFRWTALPSSGSEKLYIDITDASNYWQLALYSGPVRLKFIANSTGIDQTESAISWAINTWYHIALVRIGSGYKVYVDGTAVMTFTSTHQIGNHTEKSIGGWSGSAGSSLTAYVDDFRISKMARYTNNFTAPTAPFADKGQ